MPETPLKDHLHKFAVQWSTMLERTVPPTGTKDGFGFHMHQIAKDAKSKAAFLLFSVRHPSMKNVIDNLQTKEDLTYQVAHHKLLAIVQSCSNTQEAEVLNANRTAPPSKNTKICMYCKERNMRFEVHLAKECRQKKQARTAEHQASLGVADMNATCFMVHDCTLSPKYSSFLDGCLVDTNYHDFSKLVDPLNIDDIQDLNCLDFASEEEMKSIEAVATGSSIKRESIFDTGTSDHMLGTLAQNTTPTSATVNVVGGRKPKIMGVGKARHQGPQGLIHITRVLPVPELGNSRLLSWQKLADQGFTMQVEKGTIQIQMHTFLKVVATLDPLWNLYLLGAPAKTTLTIATENFSVWHPRLGHLPPSALSKPQTMGEDLENLPATASKEQCRDCLLGKSSKLPTTSPGSKTMATLELIPSDLSGKFSVQARERFQYSVTFRDDFTCYIHLYLIKTKDGTLATVKQYVASVETQAGKR